MKPEFDPYGMRIKRKKGMAKVKPNKMSKERIEDAFAAISGEIDNIWSRIGELDTRLTALDKTNSGVYISSPKVVSQAAAIRDELNYILDHIRRRKYTTAYEIFLYLRNRLSNWTP